MSLDKRLKEILLDKVASEYYFEGSDSSSWEDNADVLSPALEAIKQAFIDEGWSKKSRQDMADEVLKVEFEARRARAAGVDE